MPKPPWVTRLGTVPREPLASLPSPLQPAPRLSDALGIEIWVKRDDLLGLGLGGNKARPLEFLMGDALVKNSDVIVTGSGPQSNWSMLAALAARRCGLDSIVCFYGDRPRESRGNLLLHGLIGTDVRWTSESTRESVDTMIGSVAESLRQDGKHPYVIPRGGRRPEAAWVTSWELRRSRASAGTPVSTTRPSGLLPALAAPRPGSSQAWPPAFCPPSWA